VKVRGKGVMFMLSPPLNLLPGGEEKVKRGVGVYL
jgi:hypothetical protein